MKITKPIFEFKQQNFRNELVSPKRYKNNLTFKKNNFFSNSKYLHFQKKKEQTQLILKEKLISKEKKNYELKFV